MTGSLASQLPQRETPKIVGAGLPAMTSSRLKMSEGQAQREGRAVLFVLVVVAAVTAVDEVRLIGQVLRVKVDLQLSKLPMKASASARQSSTSATVRASTLAMSV